MNQHIPKNHIDKTALRLALVYAVTVLWVAPAYANWGADVGGSVATGSFRGTGTDQVEMQSEFLSIRLYRDRAKVKVQYILKNTGDAVDVTAGFPCLGIKSDDNEKNYFEIEDYHLIANGTPIPYRTEPGDVNDWKHLFDKDFLDMVGEGSEVEEGVPRILWLTSTVHFGKNESKNIQIDYESLYESSSGGYSEDINYNDDYFRYLLSTANVWKGPIQKGRVTIKAVTINPASITIKPGRRFRNTPQGFVWEFTNLKPTSQDNIEVSMNNKFYTIFNSNSFSGDASWYSFEGPKYYFDFHSYSVTASSEKRGYPATNVGDVRNETAWVAGRSDQNESITLTLKESTHVDRIGIVPGYAKSKEIYFANNRIREIEVTINGSRVVKASFPDEYISFSPGSKKAYEWIDLGNYSGDVKTLQLTVKSVYPGNKYNDTCISEILLRKRLKEKPQVKRAG